MSKRVVNDAPSFENVSLEKTPSSKKDTNKNKTPLTSVSKDSGKPAYWFSPIMDAFQEGFIVLDNHFRIKEVNPAFCGLTGFSAEELIGMHVSELAASDPPNVIEARNKKIISNGSAIFEINQPRKDGSFIEMEISATHVSETVSNWSVLCLCRNISGRKRSEAESAARVAISGIFQQSLELSETYQKLAECLVSTLGFPMAFIGLYDATQGEMVNVGVSGTPNFSTGTHFPVDKIFSGKVVLSGHEIYEPFVSKRVNPEYEPLRQLGIETLICVPMRIENEVVGTISVADTRSRYNGPSWISNLTAIATTLGLEIKRKQTEQELRESEELHRSILNASPDGIAITDLDGHITKVSPAILKIFGYIREDKVLGRSIMEFILPENRERAQQNIGLMLEGVFTGPAEYQVIRADGSIFYAEANAKFKHDATGQPIGLVFVIRDISERKKNELALAEETIRRQILFEQSKDGIVILNGDFSVIESNKSFADMLGYTLEEMKRLFVWDWDANYMTREELEINWPKSIQQNFTFETKHRRKDGSVYDSEISWTPADWNGQPLSYCVCRDITERKKAELAIAEESIRRRILFEQAKDGIVILNGDFSVIESNKSFADMLGYTLEEMKQLSLWDWEANFPTLKDLQNTWPKPEKQNFTFETMHRRKDGSTYEVEISLSLVNWNGQELAYCVCRDITERNKARLALQESEEKLKLFIEHAPASLAMLDRNLRYIYASHRWFSDFEIENQNIIGRSHYDVFPEIPDRWKEVHRRALAGEVIKSDEDIFLRQNGKVLWRRWEVRPWYNLSNEIGGIIILTEDITERKKASDALQESEKRFAKIFEASPAAIGISRLDDGEFIQVNPAFARLIGYSRHEIIGHTSKEVGMWVLPDQRELVISELKEKKRIENIETTVRHKNGEIRNILKSFELIDLNGELYLLGILTDITESKKALHALRDSEARYQLISENMGDVIWMYDFEENHFTYVSPSVVRAFGTAPEELLKQSVYDGLTPNSQKYVKALLPTLIKALESGDETARTTTHEVDQFRHDGSIVTNEIVTTLVQNKHGKVASLIGVTRDITARKLAESKLKESEERFKLTFFTSPDSISISKLENGEYVEVNEGFCHLLGYTREETIGKTSAELNIWQNQKDRTELVNELKEKGSFKNFEGVFRRKDGTLLTGFMSGKIITFDEKPHLLAITRDITERKRAQEKLKESEERLRSLIETTADWIWEVDSTGHYTYASSKVKDILGYTPQEVLGRTPFDLMPEDEAKRVSEIFTKFATSKKPFTHLENINRHRDGTLVVLETSGVPVFDSSGMLIGYRGMDRDVTDRKRAEEARRQWADAFETCGHGIAMGNPDNNTFLACNPAFASMLQHQVDDIIGSPIINTYDPTDHPHVVKCTNDADRLGLFSYTSRMVRNDNSIFPVQVDLVSVRDTNGKLLYRVATVQDITERKFAEEEREKLQSQLAQAQKMESVGRLAGGVAHDFNNFLMAIVGYAELCRHELPPNHSVHKWLNEIENSVERSANLTRQLLAFARKQTIVPKVLDLNDTVTSMLKLLRRLIGEDIELAWMPGGNLWQVKVDPTQIDQILANLCVNARDAIASVGNVTIETKNVTFDDAYCAVHGGAIPGEYVLLRVSDDGCGMEKDVIQHIFDPFFTTKEAGKGTGLGLATVYGIIKQNNGYINVYSEPGKGTSFALYLPHFVGESVQTAKTKAKEPPKGQGETILLVEDDKSLRTTFSVLLDSLDYKVLVAETPLEALDIFGKNSDKLDLLLTDVIMPEMNGHELSEKLVAIKQELKVLYMSGYTADMIGKHGILDEGVHFIAKPFSLDELARKVRTVLESK